VQRYTHRLRHSPGKKSAIQGKYVINSGSSILLKIQKKYQLSISNMILRLILSSICSGNSRSIHEEFMCDQSYQTILALGKHLFKFEGIIPELFKEL
jgi:hypothetical protein